MEDPLTIREAMTLTGRSRSTFERWIAHGLLDVVVSRNAAGRVVRRAVSEADVFKVLRSMNRANPSVAAVTDDDTPP